MMMEGGRKPRAEADAALGGHEVSDRRLRILSPGLGDVSTAMVKGKTGKAAISLLEIGMYLVLVAIKGEKWRIPIIGSTRHSRSLEDISSWWCSAWVAHGILFASGEALGKMEEGRILRVLKNVGKCNSCSQRSIKGLMRRLTATTMNTRLQLYYYVLSVPTLHSLPLRHVTWRWVEKCGWTSHVVMRRCACAWTPNSNIRQTFRTTPQSSPIPIRVSDTQ